MGVVNKPEGSSACFNPITFSWCCFRTFNSFSSCRTGEYRRNLFGRAAIREKGEKFGAFAPDLPWIMPMSSRSPSFDPLLCPFLASSAILLSRILSSAGREDALLKRENWKKSASAKILVRLGSYVAFVTWEYAATSYYTHKNATRDKFYDWIFVFLCVILDEGNN